MSLPLELVYSEVQDGGPEMARKRHKPEEIVTKLRQVAVLHGQGRTLVDAIRQIGVTEVTYYRWRKEYGGVGVPPVLWTVGGYVVLTFSAAAFS